MTQPTGGARFQVGEAQGRAMKMSFRGGRHRGSGFCFTVRKSGDWAQARIARLTGLLDYPGRPIFSSI